MAKLVANSQSIYTPEDNDSPPLWVHPLNFPLNLGKVVSLKTMLNPLSSTLATPTGLIWIILPQDGCPVWLVNKCCVETIPNGLPVAYQISFLSLINTVRGLWIEFENIHSSHPDKYSSVQMEYDSIKNFNITTVAIAAQTIRCLYFFKV